MRGCYRNYGRNRRCVAPLLAILVLAAGCGPDPELERLRETSRGAYDTETGALTEITFDKNGNGVVDTWTQMVDGRAVSSILDEDEDGIVDRWEEYDDQQNLVRAGWVRVPLVPEVAEASDAPVLEPDPPADLATPAPPREPDTWAYMGPDGEVSRVEYFDLDLDGARILTLREFHENQQLARTEEDVNADGAMDKWEVFVDGQLKTSESDANGDGKPDQRFTYNAAGRMVLIESAPDANGRYTKRVVPGGPQRP